MGRENGCVIPSRGDRIELIRTGVKVRGQVWYADQLQILVKWDNGTSSSLRVGHETFWITDRSKLDVKVGSPRPTYAWLPRDEKEKV